MNKYLIGTDIAKGDDFTNVSVWRDGMFIMDYPDIIIANTKMDEKKLNSIEKFVKELLKKNKIKINLK